MLKQKLMGGSGVEPIFVEDVMSTYLYTGNGSTQTITNGIDLAGKGGLVWIKSRPQEQSHSLFDDLRGTNGARFRIQSNTTAGNSAGVDISFLAAGFGLGPGAGTNSSGDTYASWTFRKQPKFFDVVTFTQTTGNTGGFTVNHSLGSVPGCIIVKATNAVSNWNVYHRSASGALLLNSTAAQLALLGFSNITATSFDMDLSLFGVGPGTTYVAYLFAHNAGGFGLTGTDNVISCGSFTTDGSGGGTVNHGFADGAQFCMVKASSTTGDWEMFDDKRTPSWSSADARLRANLSNAEDTVNRLSGSGTSLTFAGLSASQTYIYILVAAP